MLTAPTLHVTRTGRLTELQARRLEAARDALARAEGIQPERLVPAPPAAPGDDAGRIEF
ncbi:MAG TPA: hypothetical protein VFX28_13415 [Methylomirabilota bacterium]|nr:hypothetical protein [Methylomirabilota bacterium]